MHASLASPRTRSSTLASGASRIEVRPPAHADGDERWWTRLHDWLRGDAVAAGSRRGEADHRLAGVRHEFARCLDDVEVPLQAGEVLMRINTARSLRELWHLRAALYGAIALQHSQFEAERRLAALNRHFPTRAPRSGFAPLQR